MKIKSKVKPSSLVCVALSLGFTPFPAPAILDGRSGVGTPREGGGEVRNAKSFALTRSA